MRSVGRDTHWRQARFETFEERIVLSAQPLGDLLDGDLAPHQQVQHAEVAPALADVHVESGVGYAHESFGFTGAGQTIAVIDTGIAYDHYALGGGFGAAYRVVGGWDFAENDANPYDDGPAGFHGTHIAGIIASDDSTHTGVASGVDLVSLRVFDDFGATQMDWIEDALQWVHDNRNAFENPITTVNLSLGTDENLSSPSALAQLEEELALLESDGIFVTVSAGNNFADYNSTGLSYPAASPYVVPVASHDGDGMLSDFSQRDQRVIVAPGEMIASTIPGHLFGSSVSNQFMNASGTSMAAPYLAGSSALLREAMQFAGHANITQDQLYDVFRDTADLVFDDVTGSFYHRMNLQSALDSILPDEYGSSVTDAHALAGLANGDSLAGMIGRLDDADFFTFTADSSGQLTLSAEVTHDMIADWQANFAGATIDGATLLFDVVEGETYTFGLASAGGLGHYNIDVALDEITSENPAPVAATEWGTIAAATFASEAVSGESLYNFSAHRDGLLTVEAMFAQDRGNIDLELYDASGQLVASSRSVTGDERLDVTATAGDEFTLRVAGTNDDVSFRITNLVEVSGSDVHVHGTAGDDSFSFAAGSNQLLAVNGVAYQFASSTASAVHFHGGEGHDLISLTGTRGNETATLRAGSVHFAGSTFEATANGVEVIDVFGGGGTDTARLYDTADNETLIARPDATTLSGSGFSNTAHDFDRVYAYATRGDDRAEFFDSRGSDRFYARPQYSTMRGSGFYNYARGFDEVTAHAGSGYDRAYIYDSRFDDSVEMYADHSVIRGSGFSSRVEGFDRTYAYATAGGNDSVVMHDSAGSDRFYARSTYSTMRGSGFYNYARGFESVHAFSTAGGFDRAYLYGSSAAESVFVTSATTQIESDAFSNSASGFRSVRTYGRGGADEAVFAEIGADDSLRGRRNYAMFRSGGVDSRVYDFAAVTAEAKADETASADVRAVDYFFTQVGDWN